MKLLGSTKSEITKDENVENVSLLEITEVVSVHYKLLTMIMNMIHESCMHLFLINHLVIYKILYPKTLHF